MSDSEDAPNEDRPKRQAKCPICGRNTQIETRPFCSGRCADIDLSRWLGGKYAIAGKEDDEEDETVSPDQISRRIASDEDDDDDA